MQNVLVTCAIGKKQNSLQQLVLSYHITIYCMTQIFGSAPATARVVKKVILGLKGKRRA